MRIVHKDDFQPGGSFNDRLQLNTSNKDSVAVYRWWLTGFLLSLLGKAASIEVFVNDGSHLTKKTLYYNIRSAQSLGLDIGNTVEKTHQQFHQIILGIQKNNSSLAGCEDALQTCFQNPPSKDSSPDEFDALANLAQYSFTISIPSCPKTL